MAEYTVQSDQNIWDIALQLYGSIEGAFDLFICNSWLTMTTDLKHGDVLQYHDSLNIYNSVVESIEDNDYLPANGERHVYYKETSQPLRIIAKYPSEESFASFGVSGEGTMVIDWGDNSDLQTVQLTTSKTQLRHYFDNEVDTRVLKIYGDFTLTKLDLSAFIGSFYPISSVVVDEFVSQANQGDLTGMKLYDGVISVDLTYSQISNLSPICDYGKDLNDTYNGLQTLDLRYVKFSDVSVLDAYLVYLAGSTTHGTRRPCTVYLTTEPSDVGMEAINTILAEDAWNEDGFKTSWKFYINDTLYTTE